MKTFLTIYKQATTVMTDLLNSDPELRERKKLSIKEIKRRFNDFENADKFQIILNSQDENIQCTTEKEDEHKSLNFLEVRIINNQMGKYEFYIYRKRLSQIFK